MIRVVFDTVVFVRSLLNRQSIWARLVFDRSEDYQLVVSPPVLREALEVLRRPELTRRFSRLSGRDPATVLDILAAARVVQAPSIPSTARDAKDDKFLATAKAGAADCLVSEDQDLLVLGEYEGIPIVTAATFLEMLDR